MQSTPPRVFKDFQLGGLSLTSFPQIETRQSSEPGVPPRASHVITGIPRRRVSILTFLDHEGARDTLEHVSLDSTALASVTLSSPGSLLLLCLFFHYCLLKSVFFPGLRLPGEFTYPPGFSYHLGTSKALSRGQSSLLNFRLMCLLSDSTVGPCRHLKSTLFP